MNPSACRQLHARTRRAFTLIEILIVIALSAVLFALLLIPLVNGIKYARQAQSLTAAQDAARITRERIERELGSAVYVFDNTSHPFQLTAGTFAAGDDKFTNFLDLEVPQASANGTPTTIVAHAYNAKLDFVLPKLNENGNPTDPTTGEPIRIGTSSTTSSPIVSDPSQIFPTAAGTTMVRYWVGLKDPAQPYNNTREEQTGVSTDNTYILYRAQFQPYKKGPNGTVTPNTDIFATRPKLDANGNQVKDANGNDVTIPELDDPDFFRYIQPGETDVKKKVDWLSATHGSMTSANITIHNARVDKWMSIAKPVIPGPNVDLVLMPHNSDGTLAYDTVTAGPCTATACPGTAHYGITHDPVPTNGLYFPIVNTSVTFRPGVVSGDASPGTTTEYNSAGVVAADATTDAAYVPTLYTTGSQSWAQPYMVTLVPPAASTGQSAGGASYYVQQDPVSGDYYEYQGTSPSGTPVFDVTTGAAMTGKTSYVPLTINAQTGAINFATPALPKPPTPTSAGDPYTRQWVYQPTTPTLDLKQQGTNPNPSPLGVIMDPQYTDDAATPNPILTARIVPGSLRVYGPDAASGPGHGQPVLYTEVGTLSASPDTAAGDNQYQVDYTNSTLTLTGNDAAATFNGTTPVSVVYDYQANVAPIGTQGKAPTPPNPPANGQLKAGTYSLLPMSVKVDYQTRDLIDVAIGVRIYDLTTGRAQIIPAETKIKVGNSNR